MRMVMYMKVIGWMISLLVKLRMLIYDVFGIGKKVLPMGVELFCFCGGGVCYPQVTLWQAQGSRCGYYFVRPDGVGADTACRF